MSSQHTKCHFHRKNGKIFYSTEATTLNTIKYKSKRMLNQGSKNIPSYYLYNFSYCEPTTKENQTKNFKIKPEIVKTNNCALSAYEHISIRKVSSVCVPARVCNNSNIYSLHQKVPPRHNFKVPYCMILSQPTCYLSMHIIYSVCI